MLVKIHSATRYVVAICDSELIGKKIFDEDGIRQIDLSGNFFMGEERNEKGVLEIMADMRREDASFNIVGEKSCELALKSRLIQKEGIIRIGGVPIALTLL